jgi:hypothetical protein
MTRLEKEQFIALMACPVDWENETGLVDWDFGPLEYNWEYILRKHAINESDIRYNRVAKTLLDENDKELGIFGEKCEPSTRGCCQGLCPAGWTVVRAQVRYRV